MQNRIKACSVNPKDIKIRAGTFDNYPGYYTRTPALPHIVGFDCAGIVEAVGDQITHLSPGDEVYYSPSSLLQGGNAEYHLTDGRRVAQKPKILSMVQAAAMPLTWITAWEALVERLEIQTAEQAGILIVNGSGGVGSIASQIARAVLKLPVVVTTASREQTEAFSRAMGATHVVNHHGDIVEQIRALSLAVPIKYVFITHTPTSRYVKDAAAICAPFVKVCSIVQDKEMPMYGTEWMIKSMTFVWAIIMTKPYYGVDLESDRFILERLARLLDEGVVKCHLQQTLPLNLQGLREAHRLVEENGVIGKIGLEVDGAENAFQ